SQNRALRRPPLRVAPSADSTEFFSDFLLPRFQGTFNKGLKEQLPVGLWCLVGDFNSVVSSNERKGMDLGRSGSEMNEFRVFIDRMKLIDVPLAGKKYTWFSADGKKRSRLNRFLMSEGLLSVWGVVSQKVGDRDILDHCWKGHIFKEKLRLLKGLLFLAPNFGIRSGKKRAYFVKNPDVNGFKKDANSRYFHNTLNYNRVRSRIVALKESNFTRPTLDGVDFQQLSLEDNLHLIAPFIVDEIKEAVWSCDGNKSLGPDGFNLNFFKSCWNVLEKDIVDFMNEFHTNSKLPKAITSSFLTLVPKKDMPRSLNDFRPISLIGSLYKILAKVLAKVIRTGPASNR
ncbi:transposon TX1 putative protein, partial [Trifolium medium]|nr:transposon TX1 putative protein [Trifolium medium]